MLLPAAGRVLARLLNGGETGAHWLPGLIADEVREGVMEVSDDEIGNSAWLTSRRRSRWRNQDPDGPDGPGQQLQCGLSSPTLSASLLLHAAEPSILATWGDRKLILEAIVSSPAPVLLGTE